MKLLTLLSLATILFACKASSQLVTYPNKKDTTIIQVPGLYQGKGKILADLQSSAVTDFKEREVFYPTIEDIIKCEKILQANYSTVMKSANAEPAVYNLNLKEPYRQYITFKDPDGNKKILILLFSCCNGNIKKCFPDWDKKSVFALHSDACSPVYSFLVDLRTGAMILY